jgi:hypothetical protein
MTDIRLAGNLIVIPYYFDLLPTRGTRTGSWALDVEDARIVQRKMQIYQR